MISLRRISAIKYFLFLNLIHFVSNAQVTENLKNRAVLLVHADYNDFFISENLRTIDSIISDYNLTQLKVDGILECYLFSVKPNCIHCDQCEYILAYSNLEHRYFKLKGFRNNEFNEFYNLLLLSSKDSSKEKVSEIIKKVRIEGYDLEKAYMHYYKNYKNSLFDDSSCFRKAIIREY